MRDIYNYILDVFIFKNYYILVNNIMILFKYGDEIFVMCIT